MLELPVGASRRGFINLLFPCYTKVLLGDGETEALQIQAEGQKGEKGCFPWSAGMLYPTR